MSAKESAKPMTQAELDRYRDELIAFFEQRKVDGVEAVTVAMLAAAHFYAPLIRNSTYPEEGFASAARVAIRDLLPEIPQ